MGLKTPIVIDSYQVGLQLTKDGLGIGILPLSTVWHDLSEKNLCEFRLKDVSTKCFGYHDLVLCSDVKQKHPDTQILTDQLEDCFSKII